MKRRYTYIYTALLSLALGCGMTACEAYLDKSPEATVKQEDAFKDFRNFQGFVEEIYNCIPDKETIFSKRSNTKDNYLTLAEEIIKLSKSKKKREGV